MFGNPLLLKRFKLMYDSRNFVIIVIYVTNYSGYEIMECSQLNTNESMRFKCSIATKYRSKRDDYGYRFKAGFFIRFNTCGMDLTQTKFESNILKFYFKIHDQTLCERIKQYYF